jgi:hypothetical protein
MCDPVMLPTISGPPFMGNPEKDPSGEMVATSIVGERSGSGGRFGCARRYWNAFWWMDMEIA